jgi:hypothetical protein
VGSDDNDSSFVEDNGFEGELDAFLWAVRCWTTCPNICVDEGSFCSVRGGLVEVPLRLAGRGFRLTGEMTSIPRFCR